jgi:hypothetical protein
LSRSATAAATDGASITRVSNIFPATAKVLKLSFDYVAVNVTGASTTSVESGGYLMIGTPTAADGNTVVLPAIAKATLKLRFETNASTSQFRVVNFKSDGTTYGGLSGVSSYYPVGTPIHIDAVFNYTSNAVIYDAPTTTASTATLAAGKVDLYINGVVDAAIHGTAIANATLMPTGISINLVSRIQNFSLDNILIQDASIVSVLPVDLVSFTGKSQSNGITLNWLTASEKNSDYFEIAKYDAINASYTTIAKVNATGNANEKTNYQYTDNQAKQGVNYYQLKLVNKDGTATTYPLISVDYNLNSFAFDVFKSDGNGYQYRIFSNKTEAAELSLLSLEGKVLSKNKIQIGAGYTSGSLATSSLNPGVYLVKLKGAGDHVTVKKIMVSAN